MAAVFVAFSGGVVALADAPWYARIVGLVAFAVLAAAVLVAASLGDVSFDAIASAARSGVDLSWQLHLAAWLIVAYFVASFLLEALFTESAFCKYVCPLGTFNFVYSKKDLDANGPTWHQRNINGTGPFVFVEHQPGAFVSGVKNENYHHEGRPYLDGFKAISAPKLSALSSSPGTLAS